MNKETIKATVSAAVVIIVNVAALWGISIDADVWTNGICAVIALAANIWAIWHNHNFTSAAQQGQQLTDAIKAGAEVEYEIDGTNGYDLPAEADEVDHYSVEVTD